MTKLYPTTADSTLIKSHPRKMKLNQNFVNSLCIENQSPKDKATTEINPTNKNSNNDIPSAHKQDNNNIFSTVTHENSNPEQSPDVCNK